MKECPKKCKSQSLNHKLINCFSRNLNKFIISQNKTFDLTGYKYTSNKFPEEFDKFRIVHLSDIHNRLQGYLADDVIKIITRNRPDIIIITGDYYDAHEMIYDNSFALMKRLADICPVYYVSGNHEELTPDIRDEFFEGVKKSGVRFLDNETETITRNGKSISLIGVRDYMSYAESREVIDRAFEKLLDFPDEEKMLNGFTDMLGKLTSEAECDFKILLSHRPELFEEYVNENINLVFSGHAHGGQFRIPFIGGLFAPNQGTFPKYAEGCHEKNNTVLIISRGIGNSSFPLRLNNHPEIIVTEFEYKN